MAGLAGLRNAWNQRDVTTSTAQWTCWASRGEIPAGANKNTLPVWTLIAACLFGQLWAAADDQPREAVQASMAAESALKSGHVEFRLPLQVRAGGEAPVMYCEWASGGRYRIGESQGPTLVVCDGVTVQTVDGGCWDARYVADDVFGRSDAHLVNLTQDQRQALELARRLHTMVILNYLFPWTGVQGSEVASRGYVYKAVDECPIPPPVAVEASDVAILAGFQPVTPSDINPAFDVVLLIDTRYHLVKAKGTKLPQELGGQWHWLMYRTDPVRIASGETMPRTMGYVGADAASSTVFNLVPDATRIGSVAPDRFEIDRGICSYSIPWPESRNGSAPSLVEDLMSSRAIALLALCFLAGAYLTFRTVKARRSSRTTAFPGRNGAED